MNMAHRTAEHYAERIMEKLGMQKRLELGLYALHSGIGTYEHCMRA